MKVANKFTESALYIVIIFVLAILPLTGVPQSFILYLFLFLIYLAMANMWNLLGGYCGLISLCQPAFIGLAGYTLVIFTWSGLPIFLGLIGGAVVAALFAVLISLPVFRLSGIYFAIGTLVVPEAMRTVFLLWRPVGESVHGKGAGYMIKGLTDISMTQIYWLALGIGVVSILVMKFLPLSKMGMGLAAIRDNDKAASSSGVNIFKLKLISFIISGAVTAVAGAIFYMFQGYIGPGAAFSMKWTLTLILATVIGGVGTEKGPIIGTIIIVILHFQLTRYGGVSLLIQGILLIIIMLLAPHGIMGFIHRTQTYQSIRKFVNGREG